MTVMKFGGTSIGTPELINNAIALISSSINKGAVLIASAMGKTTNQLQKIADEAGRGNDKEAFSILQKIKKNHQSSICNLLSGKNQSTCLSELEKLFEELESIIRGLSLLKEWSPRSNDRILGFGEQLSTLIIASRATEIGINIKLVDSRKLIRTDDHFMQANVLTDYTFNKIKKNSTPKDNQLIIAQGFIAATQEGIQTTLGRGGSDYTATLFGAALSASCVIIWTDVNGVLTCDPRIVHSARTLSNISYREAAELAYFGANVIHPDTIAPAINNSIPVEVRNTNNASGPFTRILDKTSITGAKAIAFKRNITLININSSRMLLAYGFLRRIFEIFEQYHTPVDLVTTSEVSVSITIDDSTYLEAILSSLKEIGNCSVESELAIISIIGEELWTQHNLLYKVAEATGQSPLRMLSLGSADINLSIVVPNRITETIVQSLHVIFFNS